MIDAINRKFQYITPICRLLIRAIPPTFLLLSTACQAFSTNLPPGVSPDQPVAYPYPSQGTLLPVPLTAPTAGNVTQEHFRLSTANRTAPADVDQEVSYGGLGGGTNTCFESAPSYTSPVIESVSKNIELLRMAGIITCGWKNKEYIELTLRDPDGRVKKEIVRTVLEKNGMPENTATFSQTYYAQFNFTLGSDDPVGKYMVTITGPDGKLQDTLDVKKPDGPLLSRVSDQELILYGFAPNETVRLIAYVSLGDKYSFVGWQKYRVDSTGKLSIAVEKFYDYVAIGNISGEVDQFIYNLDPLPEPMSMLKNILK